MSHVSVVKSHRTETEAGVKKTAGNIGWRDGLAVGHGRASARNHGAKGLALSVRLFSWNEHQ